MTAIALLLCELYDLSDAFCHNQFNWHKSLHYFRTKRRYQLFKFHCRKHWLRQYKTKLTSFNSMRNAVEADIDFAVVEATTAYQYVEKCDLQQENYVEDIEIINGVEFNTSFYEYSDPLPKYYNDQIGNLCRGVSFTFCGKIAINCERFSINFIYNNASKDVALHINPRLPQNYLVRNTKVNGVWGPEEVSSALPFLLNRGDRFNVQVLVTEACYMISINGNHFAEYSHRIPFDDVKILEVKGDVEDVQMQRTMVKAYPQRMPESVAQIIEMHLEEERDEVDGSALETISIPQDWCLISAFPKLSEDLPFSNHNVKNQGLTLPYYGKLVPDSLKEGRCLRIEGRVRLLPHSFYINLQQGQNIWPHPVIAFHLNPRFSKSSSGATGKAIVCRNAWYDGSWAKEERSELDTNFSPGRTFSLAIVCSKDSFEVYVNRLFITEFKYQVNLNIVDTVYIQGDVKLWNVTLEKNPMIRGKNVRIYHNPRYTEEYL